MNTQRASIYWAPYTLLLPKSSPELRYGNFSDSTESLAAAPSVFEQLSVVFDSFCGHVPLLQNSTFHTPCPSVVNADFQFRGVVCVSLVAGLPAILEVAHMSHALGPPHGKAKIAGSISEYFAELGTFLHRD